MDALVESPSEGGLLAAFAPIPPARARALQEKIVDLGRCAKFMVPSHDPDTSVFDGKRYWRGPVWLIVNYMIADGIARAGETAVVDRIVSDSLRLEEESDFAEY